MSQRGNGYAPRMDAAHTTAENRDLTNEAAGELHVSAIVGGAAVGVVLTALLIGSVILVVALALGAAIGGVCALGIASLKQDLWRRSGRRDADQPERARHRPPVAGRRSQHA